MNPSVRRWLLPLHRWIGLTAGLVIVVLAVTGSLMMFRPQIDPIVYRNLLSVASCQGRASIDLMTRQALAAHPTGDIDFIRIPFPEAGSARVPAPWIRFVDKETFYFDPCTGAMLGKQNRYSGGFGTIERIHRFRFIPNGGLIPGVAALSFVTVLVLGGLLLWLPPTLRGLRRAARFNPRLKGAARRLDLHRTLGLYAAPIILMSALTGLTQSFGWYKDGVYMLAGSPPPAKPPSSTMPANRPRLSMQSHLARALEIVPAPTEVQIRYPSAPDDAVDGFFIERGAPHPNARSEFFLDAYTGVLLRFVPYAHASPGHRLYFWMLSWHHGLVGGLFTQLLVVAGALSIPLLGYAGIANYLRRKLRKAETRRGASATATRAEDPSA